MLITYLNSCFWLVVPSFRVATRKKKKKIEQTLKLSTFKIS